MDIIRLWVPELGCGFGARGHGQVSICVAQARPAGCHLNKAEFSRTAVKISEGSPAKRVPPGDSPARMTVMTEGPQPWGFTLCALELKSPGVPPRGKGLGVCGFGCESGSGSVRPLPRDARVGCQPPLARGPAKPSPGAWTWSRPGCFWMPRPHPAAPRAHCPPAVWREVFGLVFLVHGLVFGVFF